MDDFYIIIDKIIGGVTGGYTAYKKSQWIDSIVKLIPFVLFLIFLIIIMKK